LLHPELGLEHFDAPGLVEPPENSIWAGEDHPSLLSGDSRSASGVRWRLPRFPRQTRPSPCCFEYGIGRG
jgi:hypothetical protein